jgi:hypothetical protein
VDKRETFLDWCARDGARVTIDPRQQPGPGQVAAVELPDGTLKILPTEDAPPGCKVLGRAIQVLIEG